MSNAPRKTTVELSVSTMRALAAFRETDPEDEDQARLMAFDVAARLARDFDAQARRDAKAAATAPKVCEACPTPITSPWSRAKFCSPRCAQRSAKRKQRSKESQ